MPLQSFDRNGRRGFLWVCCSSASLRSAFRRRTLSYARQGRTAPDAWERTERRSLDDRSFGRSFDAAGSCARAREFASEPVPQGERAGVLSSLGWRLKVRANDARNARQAKGSGGLPAMLERRCSGCVSAR